MSGREHSGLCKQENIRYPTSTRYAIAFSISNKSNVLAVLTDSQNLSTNSQQTSISFSRRNTWTGALPLDTADPLSSPLRLSIQCSHNLNLARPITLFSLFSTNTLCSSINSCPIFFAPFMLMGHSSTSEKARLVEFLKPPVLPLHRHSLRRNDPNDRIDQQKRNNLPPPWLRLIRQVKVLDPMLHHIRRRD